MITVYTDNPSDSYIEFMQCGLLDIKSRKFVDVNPLGKSLVGGISELSLNVCEMKIDNFVYLLPLIILDKAIDQCLENMLPTESMVEGNILNMIADGKKTLIVDSKKWMPRGLFAALLLVCMTSLVLAFPLFEFVLERMYLWAALATYTLLVLLCLVVATKFLVYSSVASTVHTILVIGEYNYYVKQNYFKRLTVTNLGKDMQVSKNFLYYIFEGTFCEVKVSSLFDSVEWRDNV